MFTRTHEVRRLWLAPILVAFLLTGCAEKLREGVEADQATIDTALAMRADGWIRVHSGK